MAKGIWPYAGASALFLVVITGYLGWDAYNNPGDTKEAARGLEAAYARAEAAGVPLELGQVVSAIAVDPEDNARRAVEALDSISAVHSGDRERLEYAVQNGQGPQAELALREIAPFMAAIDETKKYSSLDMGRDWGAGFEVLFPEFSTLKSAAKALGIRARKRAKEGDVDGALSDLKGQQNLARLAGSDPTLISALVEVAIRAIAAGLAQGMAEDWQNDPAKLARLRQTFQVLPQPTMRRAMLGEAYMGILTMRNHADAFRAESALLGEPLAGLPGNSSEPGSPKPQRLQPNVLPRTTRGRATLARILEGWADIFEAINKHQGDEGATGDAVDAIGARIGAQTGPSYKGAQYLFPVFSQASGAFTKAAALEQATLGLISAVEHKAKTGRYPASLAQAGFTAKDPFSGKPFGYRQTAQGIRVWSAGPDKVDDGGRTSQEASASSPAGSPPPTADTVAAFPSTEPASSNKKTRWP